MYRKRPRQAPMTMAMVPLGRSPYKRAKRVLPASSGKVARGRRRMNIRSAGLLGIETKYFDVYASAVAIPAPTDCSGGEMQPEGGCTGCLSAPAQGDSSQNRDGRAIQFKSIFVSGRVQGSAIATQASVRSGVYVFVALVLDTQANGATVVSEQVFTNPNDTADVNCWPLRNIEYSPRYRVLDHKTLRMDIVAAQDAAGTSSQASQPRNFILKWKGDLPIRFTSGITADVANVENNALHVIAFATSTTFTPTISYNSRMRFCG